ACCDAHSLYSSFYHAATSDIYTLSLHDAIPICFALSVGGHLRASGRNRQNPAGEPRPAGPPRPLDRAPPSSEAGALTPARPSQRSEEHTSELQSPCNLVCRHLLEKKNKEY